MSNKFNQSVTNVKEKIDDECRLFSSIYKDFRTLSDKLIENGELDESTMEYCKNFLDELNEGNFRLIFCGEVKSGKSRCIIEFLSGKINLPSCDTPTTTFFTAIYFSNKPILYSENLNKEVTIYDFDGINVSNGLVGRNNISAINDGDMEVIYNVGTPHTFTVDNFIIIDTPGLNETKSISEAFFKNLKKLNPQLIVYLFDCGRGFTVGDHVYYTNVIAHSRKGLKKIFLFNKYDAAFEEEPVFTDESDDETNNCGEDVSDSEIDEEGMAEDLKNSEQYKIDYEKHLDKLLSFSSEENKLVLFGYSAKIVQKMRQKKENSLPFLLAKHIDFLREIQNQINFVNRETIENILRISELGLSNKFKSIHDQILQTKDTDFGRIKLEGEAKKRLLNKFDQIHAEINIQPPKTNQFELEGMINEIIENQVKQIHDTLDSKLRKITNSLIQFFTNRYINLFSNVIQASLDCISFDSLSDEIRKNDLQSFFPHAFCTLEHEIDSYNLHLVIDNFFREQTNNLKQLTIDENIYNFQSPESFKQYFKAHLKYDIDSILPNIEDYKRIKLSKERKLLESAIKKKINEISDNYQMTEQETETMIKENIGQFKIWINLNNHYITSLDYHSQIAEDSKIIISGIIGDSIDLKECNFSSTNSIIYKKETVDFDAISCRNSDMIQYFLRIKSISQHLFKSYSYFHEKSKHLYFITDVGDFQPLRKFLPQLNNRQKVCLIRQLVDIIDTLCTNRLSIDNFGPDIIFGKICSETEVEIKLTETAQRFHQWKYTLDNGNSSNEIFFKLCFHNPNNTIFEAILSMFYSFGWTILIILHGKCIQLMKSGTVKDNYKMELNKLFKEHVNNRIYANAKLIIDKCLKQRFENESLTDIFRLIKRLKESQYDM